MSSVDLERLRIFAEVARLGSVTRAARRLRLQQPTVSHALATLEREVGVVRRERLPRATPDSCRVRAAPLCAPDGWTRR